MASSLPQPPSSPGLPALSGLVDSERPATPSTPVALPPHMVMMMPQPPNGALAASLPHVHSLNTHVGSFTNMSQLSLNTPRLGPSRSTSHGVGPIPHRSGTVLDSSTLIKVDDYPRDKHNVNWNPTWFSRRVSGAEKVRCVPGTGIIGVAQPTVHGVRGILNCLNAGRGASSTSFIDPEGARKRVLWINLREEPLLYVNGRSVVLREVQEPFQNIEAFRGISEQRLRDLEYRLKEDVVAEASRCGGSVMLHEETQPTVLEELWEAVPPDCVMTPEEVFFRLRVEGYRVQYVRVPSTSGRSPNASFFDHLMQSIVTFSDRETWVVVNCQTGVARSTLAMVAACQIQFRRGFVSQNVLDSPKLKPSSAVPTPVLKAQKHHKGNLSIDSPSFPNLGAKRSNDSGLEQTDRGLLAGWYQPVLQMVRLLVGGGREAKERTDLFVDMCATVSNLRVEVFTLRALVAKSMHGSANPKYNASRAAVALRRYMLLVLFDAYLADRVGRDPDFLRPSASEGAVLSDSDTEVDVASPIAAPIKSGSSQQLQLDQRTFKAWLSARRELVGLLKTVHDSTLTSLEAALPPDAQEISLDMKRAALERRGIMLNTDTILKLDDFGFAEDLGDEVYPGLHNFRRVPGSRVYGVATMTAGATRAVSQLLRDAHGEGTLYYVNLREEPIVYVKDRPFVLRSVQKPFGNLEGFTDMDADRLEKAEERLKADVLEEARRCGGRVLMHSENQRGVLQVFWEDVDEDDVLTPREVCEVTNEGAPIKYTRVPMAPGKVPSALCFETLVNLVHTAKSEPEAHFLFFCQRGKGRSTLATVVAMLEIDDAGLVTLSGLDAELMPTQLHHSTTSEREGDFPAILSLVRVLKEGPAAKRWLDHIIDQCEQIVNVRRNISRRMGVVAAARSEEEANSSLDTALLDLRRYFSLITLAAYELQTKLGYDTGGSYRTWLAARPELQTLMDEIKGRDALVLQRSFDHVEDMVVRDRQGQVLGSGSVLKTDHFPGCKRLPNPAMDVDGAPNFRPVWQCDDDLRVYGTGIPTREGLLGVLNALRGKNVGEKVVWINLREEPILYINGRPFVLRRLDHPFANLEHTGISRSRVEDMEMRLKADVLEEANRSESFSILIHEEDEAGGLSPTFEVVVDVQTPAELFATTGVDYHRIPITDEQAPKPSAFDAIVDAVAVAPSTAHVVFNCQMGRGRTTTGLIIACCTRLRAKNRLLTFAAAVDAIKDKSMFRSRTRRQLAPPNEARELKGDFSEVLVQTRLMDHGSEAKAAVDAVIDVCDAMQNLREAVFDAKSKSLSKDAASDVRMAAAAVAAHYLRRYVQLVQFASYLLSVDTDLGPRRIKFSSWLKSRPELANSLRKNAA